MGDGALIKRKNRRTYEIQYYQKSKERLKSSIIPRLEQVGISTSIKGFYRNSYYLKFGNKQLYLLFKQSQEDITKIFNYPQLAQEFVKGFFDAEGSVPHVEKYLRGERKRKRIPPQIGFHQNGEDSKFILQCIRDFLIQNGIKCSKISGPLHRKQSNKPEYRFFIYGTKEIKKFFFLIQPEHPEKRRRIILLLLHVGSGNRKL